MTVEKFNFINFYIQITNILNEILYGKLFFRCITIRKILPEFFQKIIGGILKHSYFANVANILE